MIDTLTLAQKAYHTYCAVIDQQGGHGLMLPVWDKLPPTAQEGWLAAMETVCAVVMGC